MARAVSASRQAEATKRWRPWQDSTGPRSAAGKAIVARNAWKGEFEATLREFSRQLQAQREALDQW